MVWEEKMSISEIFEFSIFYFIYFIFNLFHVDENLETPENFWFALIFFIVLVALSMGKIKTFHWISN